MGRRIAVVGAGASGLAAAVAAARRGACVTVYERNALAGRKLRMTGNGRCNFTNTFMTASCYHETEDSRLAGFLQRFTPEDAVEFFRGIGVESTVKDGYVYPMTGQASTVAEALLEEAVRLGAEIRYGTKVSDVNDLDCERVILAAGSRACPKTGSDGSGYRLLERLGIRYTRVLPALCALEAEEKDFFRTAAGVRVHARVTVLADGQAPASDEGELQLTEKGLSGIPVFQVSREASRALDSGRSVRAEVDFLPQVSRAEDLFRERAGRGFDLYTGVFPDKLAEALRDAAGTDVSSAACFVKHAVFRIRSAAGFDKAQACTGGVPLESLDDGLRVTVSVRSEKEIYVCGELCDVDGICGGYNLHWAWCSGLAAGGAAAC